MALKRAISLINCNGNTKRISMQFTFCVKFDQIKVRDCPVGLGRELCFGVKQLQNIRKCVSGEVANSKRKI